ncbi:MAG TPA: LysR family transcriptional regulator [Myxococcales bacterium]|nr:LysR family transcriptional regulator [Myxococcales bacterium]
MDWSDLKFVLAVRRAGTLTSAARTLGLSQSTVTRRLVALHKSLGARVLERRGLEYALTPLGERLWPMLSDMEDRALALERAAQDLDARPAGVVRITTVDALAVRLLAPSLKRFRELYPEVTLEIDSSARTLDLGRREADLALRLGKPRQESLVARKVGRFGLTLYASEAYLARRGMPPPLDGHELIDDDEEQSWAPDVKWSRALTAGARIAARMQTWQGRTAAAEAGAGIAVLPCYLGDASMSLRRVSDEVVHYDLWLLVHRELRQVARIRVVQEFVAQLVAENAARLAG